MATRSNPSSWSRCILVCCATLLFVGTAPLGAQDVQPGIDIWTTPAGGASFDDLSSNPIPAGFFDPGSDPFDGVLQLEGLQLPNFDAPSNPLPFDTVVERLQIAPLPEIGAEVVIPIEIKALSLVSSSPITVTYDGGQNPELWDVKVSLSSNVPQTQGTMTIRKTCAQGGTFDSSLPVQPKLIFSRQSDHQVRILDDAIFVPNFNFQALGGRWVYQPIHQLAILQSFPGAVTDGDCDGNPDPPLAGTTNFVPGIWELACEPTCLVPPPEEPPQRKRLTREEEMLAAHGVLPAQEPPPDFDGDGIPDDADNCPNDVNPLQEDVDVDSVGDVCDNCVPGTNPCQEDGNLDGIGDLCDPIFTDGFESGDLQMWSHSVGG